MEERVILVDKNNKEIGAEEKLKAHRQGKLHRAFSVFVFNSQRQLLLQKRPLWKYHSPGLWSNTCCSHPRPGEQTEKAVHRRLMEELGFDCPLKEIFSFIYYKPRFKNDLYEHEYDHVFAGKFDGQPKPNSEEVSDWQWFSLNELNKALKQNPQNYTVWLRIIFDKYFEFLRLHFSR